MYASPNYGFQTDCDQTTGKNDGTVNRDGGPLSSMDVFASLEQSHRG